MHDAAAITATDPGTLMDHPTSDDLLRVPLTAGLAADTREALSQHFAVRQYEAGRSLITEGRHGYSFFILDRGEVTVTQEGQELRRLGPGDFFGEIAILGQGRRTASVTTSRPVVVWEMFGTSFRDLEAARPEVAAALQEAMRTRLAAG